MLFRSEEARLAEAATTKLRELLNDGEFEMVGRVDDMQDRYGRFMPRGLEGLALTNRTLQQGGLAHVAIYISSQ